MRRFKPSLRGLLRAAVAASLMAAAVPSWRPAPLAAQAPRSTACVLDSNTTQWMQRAVSGWTSVRDALGLEGEALPWMVFYNTTCAWHAGFDSALLESATPMATTLRADGAPLVLRALPHTDKVWLPNGAEVPSHRNTAFASLYRDGTAAFFVVAIPAMWRTDPEFGADHDLEAFFLGVTMHELTHTRHLPLIIPRVRAVAARAGVKNLQLDDDVIQNTFSTRPGFREAFEAERDLFFEAAAAPDSGSRRTLLRRGLDMARARRAKFYSGDERHYQDFEDIFLAMEGAGQWAAYRFALMGPPPRTRAEAIAFVRDHKYWSQEEGLALFLLLELEVPGWQTRVFASDDPGPFALLEEALARRAAPQR